MVVCDNYSGTSQDSSSSQVSWNHVIGSGNNRILLIGIACNYSGYTDYCISSVTVGSQSATPLTQTRNGNVMHEVWYLLNPTTSPQQPGYTTITATMRNSQGFHGGCGSVSYYGVNQSTPSSNVYTGNSTTPQVEISLGSSLFHQTVFQSLGIDCGGSPTGSAFNFMSWLDRETFWDNYPDATACIESVGGDSIECSGDRNNSWKFTANAALNQSSNWVYVAVALIDPANADQTISGNLEVQGVLTIDGPKGNWIDMGVIQGMGGAPILQVNQSLMTKNDLVTYGFISSQTDPSKSSGGGAFCIGHGWVGSGAPPVALSGPLICLTDSGVPVQSGSGSFPSMTSGGIGSLFNRTDQHTLNIYTGSGNPPWNVAETTNFSGNYDTLFLVMNNLYTPANLDLGNLTCHSAVEPGSDNSCSVGTSMNMFQMMYTRGLIIGNNSAPQQPEYFTFSIDSLGTTINVTSAGGGGTIAPDPSKPMNLGSSTNAWSSITCKGLTIMKPDLSSNSTLSYWTGAIGTGTPLGHTSSAGIASGGDFYIPRSIWLAGDLIFNPQNQQTNTKYAYMVWVDIDTIALLCDNTVHGFNASYVYNGVTYHLGAMDFGAVFTNYLQPLNNTTMPNNYVTVGGSLIPALSTLGVAGISNTCNIGGTSNPWYWGYFNNLTINNALYDSAGHGGSSYSGYFLSLNSSGYPVWVPSSSTWNGGTVTTPILIYKSLTNGSGVNTLLTVEGTGLSSIGDATELLFSNGGGNYCGAIRLVNTGASPNYLTPHLEFYVQAPNTYTYSNLALGMTLDGSGDLTLAGYLDLAGCYLSVDNNATLRIASASSSVTIGAQNSSYIHFISNGGLQFYFNNDLITTGHFEFTTGANITTWTTSGGGYQGATPSSGIQTSGDFYVDGNQNLAGGLQFSANVNRSYAAYLIWSNSAVLTLGASYSAFYQGSGHDGYSGYFGALDCGAVFCSYINPIGTSLTLTLNGNTVLTSAGIATDNILPRSGGSGFYVGNSTSPWNYVYAEYVYEHNSGGSGHSCYGFDYLDDLSFVKGYKVIDEGGVQKIDMAQAFPFLLDEKGFTSNGKRFGFTVGCLKQLSLKGDEQDLKIEALQTEIEDLRLQLKMLKGGD